MASQQNTKSCLDQILRIAAELVPNKEWHTLFIEGSILGSSTAVKSWYSVVGTDIRVEFSLFDLDYINQDNDNNMVGNFIEQLREVTYEAARGAWYIVEISFHKNVEQPIVQYNYYDAPRFRRPMSIDAYKKDLKVYPRPAHLMPDWLQ